LKAIDWLLGKNLEGLSSKQRNDLEVILTLYEPTPLKASLAKVSGVTA
jgi:hypothetical protein